MDLPPRRWLVRGVLGLVVGSLVVVAAVSAVAYEPPSLGSGAVEQPANGSTIVSVQGFHFRGVGNAKKPARLASAGPRATTEWVYDGSKRNARWFYDVDPLSNGNLLVTSTVPNETVVFELDPHTQKRVWTERFDAEDTHDVDLINGDQLLVANMREYNGSTGVSNDRLFVYDRGSDEIVWEWYFKNHFPNATDGGFSADWSHVNDVDKIGDGKYLASPRNFDQAIVIDRLTGNITMRLGRDGQLGTLFEQHNPDYLESENGTPTILVADSENDRIVEYVRTNDSGNEREWERAWELSGGFNWPRDADRLPNGNTLVTDTLNHRVVEVTPTGEVVWEYYAPWAPYDAERLSAAGAAGANGTNSSNATNASIGGSNGPTMTDLNATGSYEVSGGAGEARPDDGQFSTWVASVAAGTPVGSMVESAAERYTHITPFFRPVWLSSWAFAALLGAALVAFPWAFGEGLYHRERIRRAAGRARSRLSR
ncbi:arylsulfotransferase family protein [Halococcus saccharolyticus]|uniref:AryLSUlfotransferase (Asst) n=1 Tax=Halococcus saccharolyticus DSM 5350 TaxID=1227455 RepID=M0MDH9_9EURY|nr:aryl-sulfate sulfotransferase [Halococcus saccharolyticus]EMA42445.1 aryLSUlfotransferase (asst) [Halococcus saccharolyticus DSM 5350]